MELVRVSLVWLKQRREYKAWAPEFFVLTLIFTGYSLHSPTSLRTVRSLLISFGTTLWKILSNVRMIWVTVTSEVNISNLKEGKTIFNYNSGIGDEELVPSHLMSHIKNIIFLLCKSWYRTL